MTVAQCQAGMDAQEFIAWQAFDRIEPIGRDWLQAGTICSTIANVVAPLLSGKKKPKTWAPEDFLPLLRKAVRKKQTGAEMEAVFRAATAAHVEGMGRKEAKRAKG